jgi:ketosteroid isomerase-like protein
MNRSDVQAWLDGYEAWRSNDPDQVGALFTDDAEYCYRPRGGREGPVRGRSAIVASWLAEPDPPGTWEASYEPYAVEGDRAVATGWSRYAANDSEPERTYHNAFLMRFADDGCCAEFTEFYMREE